MSLISVCIPAFNRATLLPALLDSILNQDFLDFDIILVEDCSPECREIAEVVGRYQASHTGKIAYHENPKTLGYDGNLRRLIELATGDYVLFMGNDDLMAQGALSAVAKAVTERCDVGVVLRSYASFFDDPAKTTQVFRYFDADRVFPPGSDTIVTFFRRVVFISGMVFKRSSCLACASNIFDGTLLYQQYLAGHLLAENTGIYLNQILAFHRLGGTPDFGSSVAEQALFVPKQQTPESSVHFMRGMLRIAHSLDESLGIDVYRRILRDIGNYSYPILSIQADRSFKVYLSYLFKLVGFGFWRIPLFWVYATGLLFFGRPACDFIIMKLKQVKGCAPRLGRVYNGERRQNNK